MLRLHDRRVPWLGLFGGMRRLCASRSPCSSSPTSTIRINVGGRPLYALSAFAVVTFELTVLFGALPSRRSACWR